MSWCGKCLRAQSETDVETDGEYEYFADSNFICKRVRTPLPSDVPSALNSPAEVPKIPDDISYSQTSRPFSKVEVARERKVDRTGVCRCCSKLLRTSFEKTDQAIQIDLKHQTPGDLRRPKRDENGCSSNALTSTTSSESLKTHKSGVRQGKPLFLMRRLFGRSNKVGGGEAQRDREHHDSNFNEQMEFSRGQSVCTTTTLFWTVRVTKK